MVNKASGTFEVTLQPGDAELGGAINRFELIKTFHGDLQGSGVGVMLYGGDPESGAAGYVAMETVTGQLGSLEGTFALQQFGLMADGSETLHYDIVPGSGSGGLAGISGSFHLTVDDDGTHRYQIDYEM